MRRPWTFIRKREFFPSVNNVSWWQAGFEWVSVQCSRRIFIERKITERFGFVHPGHDGPHKQWSRLHEHYNHWSWVCGYDPETKSFRHFHFNENPMRALNTNSLKCCLSSTGAPIERREKNACIRMKVPGRHMLARFIEIHQVF